MLTNGRFSDGMTTAARMAFHTKRGGSSELDMVPDHGYLHALR